MTDQKNASILYNTTNIRSVLNMGSYIAIDLKSYYASVECVARGLDPLKANLLVADETRSDKTICLAVSPALKSIGVPSRPRLFEAKRAIRNAERRLRHRIEYIVAPPRMAEYIRISAEIYKIYLKYVAAEDIHIYSIDECFIDAMPYQQLYKADDTHNPTHMLAMAMICDVLKNTGITATVGIGTNLYLAKIAMDIVAKKSPANKDGVRIAQLDEEDYRMFLWTHRPLTDFWQIGHGTENRLHKQGMYTMGDVCTMSLVNEELFYKIFGINAELLIDHAWGLEPCTMADIKEYRPDVHSLSTGQVLPRPYRFDEARLVFTEMVDSLTFDMAKKNIISDHFSFWIGFDYKSLENGFYSGPVHIDYYGRPVPKHVVGSVRLKNRRVNEKIILTKLRECFDKKVSHTLLIRRMGISANNIHENDNCYQLDLFTDYEALEKENDLTKAMLEIRHRYGSNAILRGFNFIEGGTARERNQQIGGHRA